MDLHRVLSPDLVNADDPLAARAIGRLLSRYRIGNGCRGLHQLQRRGLDAALRRGRGAGI